MVIRTIQAEEERFQKTLQQGLDMLDNIMSSIKSEGKSVIPGKEAFELYDTYGFPLDLTQNVAGEQGLMVDEDGFQNAMEKQRERGRAAWQAAGGIFQTGIYNEILKENGPTVFKGYENISIDNAQIIAIVKDEESISGAKAGDELEIVLDKTPFYGESGGQVGDTGWLTKDGVKIQVLDSVRPIPDIIAHKCKILEGKISPGDAVLASVDGERRQRIAANHTATHILQSALRSVLGGHVAQSGSLVASDRLRFDFNHYEGLSHEELRKIEEIVNRRIRSNNSVELAEMKLQEAKDKGATALFGEKYGETVRVVRLDDYSMELCGGTHLKAVGEIGEFRIIGEGSIAAGVRRIEALTGESAYLYGRQMEEQLLTASDILKVKPMEVISRIESLIQQNRELEREIGRIRQESAKSQVDKLLEQITSVNGIRLLAVSVENIDRDGLRSLLDELKARIGSGVVLLGTVIDDKVAMIAGVTEDLIKTKGLKAGEIIREVAKIAGGSGGGRPDMAQAGGKDPSMMEKALDSVADIIAQQL
ncbi:alanine--tRNA ligase [Candidatus Poribacteria bacterium]|nr:alanine--tRNA ligase [Candidatus Poribacteria bacterium]